MLSLYLIKRKTMKSSKFWTCWAVFVMMSGFSLFAGVKQDIKISLEEKQIQDLSPHGLTMVFYVNLTNTSSRTYGLSGYHYRFMVNQQEYLRLQTSLNAELEIAPQQNTMVALPIKVTYDLLMETVEGLQEQAACYVMGEFVISERGRERGRLPVAFSGEFPILKGPEISFTEIIAHSVTIGGADLSFNLSVMNGNGFELMIDRIRYSLSFGGHPVVEGTIAGDKNIDARGSKLFTLPLLLNFFEVGKDVHGILQGKNVPCRIVGEFEVTTVWGPIVIPFDENGQIPIQSAS